MIRDLRSILEALRTAIIALYRNKSGGSLNKDIKAAREAAKAAREASAELNTLGEKHEQE
jgi:hypothetical protein